MANVVDCVEEDAILDDANQSDLEGSNAVEDVGVGEGSEHLVESDLVEAAVLDDTYEERATLEVSEDAVLDDATTAGRTVTTLVAESLVASDEHASEFALEYAEAAVLDDASSSELELVDAEEAAILNDATSVGITVTSTSDDPAVLDDAVMEFVQVAVDEVAVLDDTVAAGLTVASETTEAAILDDAVVVSSGMDSDAVDAALLNDGYEDQLDAATSVADEAYLDDLVTGGGNAAWTAHVEPWAASTYTNAPWNSMATIGGALFAAGPEGIYQLTGATDQGTAIAASITHDWLNWSPGKNGAPVPNHHLKRPRYLYLEEVKVAGQLALTLGYVTIDGAEAESEYPLPTATATGYVNLRVPLGRGIRSQHLRPAIRNVAGADFEFGGGRLAVDALARNL